MRARLFGKLAYRCKLIRPFPVLILHFTDGEYVVQDGQTKIFGHGPTKGEALAEFRHLLASDYLFLKQQEAVLHPSLQAELEYLKQFVRRY